MNKLLTIILLFFLVVVLSKSEKTLASSLNMDIQIYGTEIEENDTLTNANVINPDGTSYTGNLSLSNDIDYYKFTLPQPGSVVINFKNSPNLNNNSWQVILYREDNEGNIKEYANMYAGKKASTTMNTLRLPAANYYIKIVAYNHSPSDYKIQVTYTPESTDSFEQEFNDSYKTANIIILGNTYAANLSISSDVDYYKFTLKKSSDMQIIFSNPKDLNSYYWSLSIYKEDKDGNLNELSSYNVGKEAKYTDKRKLSAGTYYIKIVSYNYSNVDYKLTVKENIPSKVTSLKSSKATSNSITLSWKSVTEATSYQVYRSTSKNSGYKLVKTVTNTTYVDKNLSSGKTYYYKVRAVDKKKQTGYFSSVLTAKTK